MRKVWGVTGVIFSGKTSLVERLCLDTFDREVEARPLFVDGLRHRAIARPESGEHLSLCRALSERFGMPLRPDGSLPYEPLMEAVIADPSAQADFSALVSPVLVADAADAIELSPGPVLLEWVRLLEDGFAPLVTGPVVVVCCSEAERRRRALEAGGPGFLERMLARRRSQPSPQEQIALCARLGKECLVLDTTDPERANEREEELSRRLLEEVRGLECEAAPGSRNAR